MINKEKNFMSAVLYVHNDAASVGAFLGTVLKVLEEHFEHAEIICVNDYSQDNSVEIIRELGRQARSTTVTVLNMSYFHGVETAMNAGMDLAIGDFVLEFDACVPVILSVYHKSLEGYDIVSASPNRRQRLTSSIFYRVFNRFTDFSYRLETERFRVLSRRVINRISSMNKSVPYRKAVYANCGLKTYTLSYESQGGTKRNKSKTDRSERTSLAMDSFIYFTNVLERMSLAVSSIFLVFTLGVIIYIVGSVFSESQPVEGWVSTMGFLSLGFFGVFSLLTFIMKYLSVMLSLIFKHQRYLIEGVEKISER